MALSSLVLGSSIDKPSKPIPASYWVVPGRLLAGEYPGGLSREETSSRLRAFLDAGFDCFIDLTAPGEREPYDAYVPRTALYLRKPIPDHDIPQAAGHMAEIQAELDAALHEGRKVYVHCRAGIGRTGTVIGCHLVARGLTGDAALAELNKLWADNERSRYWAEVPETREQKEFVRSWRPIEPRTHTDVTRLYADVPPLVDGLAASATAEAALLGEDVGVARALRGRFVGSLVGLASADALAAPTQFRKPGSFGVVGDLLGGGPFDLPRGGWSDDTAMALVLADSLIASSGFDAHDQVRRYARWQKEGYLSATGQCLGITASVTRAIATALYRSMPFAGSHDPEQAAKEVLSRVAPVVMFFFADGTAAVDQSVQAARITCQAPVALDCVRILAAMVHQALAGRDKQHVLRPDELLPVAELKPAVRTILEGSYTRNSPPAITGAGTVIDALEAALWAFHRSRDFRSGALEAVNLGGDSDVVGAVYGQLAGAYYGINAIPANWRNSLMRKELLQETADHLLTHALVALAE